MEEKNTKNARLIVAVVILGVLLLVCLVVIMLFLFGCFKPEQSAKETNQPGVEKIGTIHESDEDALTEADMMSKQQATDTFAEIDVELDVFDINIKRGDKYEVDYACPRQMEPEIQVKDNRLQVRGNGKYFTMNGNVRCELTIMIPQEAKLGITHIADDTGNINLEQVISYTNDIRVDTGFIRMSGCESASTTIHSDTGDMSMESNDLGVTDLSSDTGSIRVQASRFQDFKAATDTGDIQIEGMVNPQEQYKMTVDVEDGSIQVNGQDQGNHYVTSSGTYSFEVRSGSGVVNIQ